MSYDSEAAIIANDLDSLIHRIEALPAHITHTEAMLAVAAAKLAINAARADIHQTEMRKRFASMDEANAA